MSLQNKKSQEKNNSEKKGFWEKLKSAFAVEHPEDLTEEEDAILTKTARWIQKRHLDTPAIFFFESIVPLNFIGSQALTFLQPLIGPLFPEKDYQMLAKVLEKRNSIAILIKKIVEIESSSEINKGKNIEKKK